VDVPLQTPRPVRREVLLRLGDRIGRRQSIRKRRVEDASRVKHAIELRVVKRCADVERGLFGEVPGPVTLGLKQESNQVGRCRLAWGGRKGGERGRERVSA